MSIVRIIFSAEYKMFKRNRRAVIIASIFLILGIYAIFYGHRTLKDQQQKIVHTTEYIDSAQLAYSEHLTADTSSLIGKNEYELAALPSLVRFNFNFLVANRPSALSQLSIGQRDLYPHYYILNAQSLYTQTLKGEIYNPFKLAAGNFDLAFVFIYLMPLLIIVLAFDIISFEKDMGTLKLLASLPLPLERIIMIRLLFRYSVIIFLVVVLLITGFVVAGALNASEMFRCLLWFVTVVSYAALWFSITYFIASFNRSTQLNALLNLTAWIAFLIVIPSLISIAVGSKGPSPETKISALMRSRNMAETDEAMHKALSDFYALNPKYRPIDTVRSPFFYFQGYSAFLALTDRATKQKVDSLNRSVIQRDAKYNLFNPINPAVNVQNLLNQFAGTDLASEMEFKQQVYQFHRKIFFFSNDNLFKNRKMEETDYLKAPVFQYFPKELNIQGITVDFAILFLSICCLSLSAYKKTAYLTVAPI